MRWVGEQEGWGGGGGAGVTHAGEHALHSNGCGSERAPSSATSSSVLSPQPLLGLESPYFFFFFLALD